MKVFGYGATTPGTEKPTNNASSSTTSFEYGRAYSDDDASDESSKLIGESSSHSIASQDDDNIYKKTKRIAGSMSVWKKHVLMSMIVLAIAGLIMFVCSLGHNPLHKESGDQIERDFVEPKTTGVINTISANPLSTLDPMKDLHIHSYGRDDDWKVPKCLLLDADSVDNDNDQRIVSTSSKKNEQITTAIPTNYWYNNVLFRNLTASGQEQEPTELARTYILPYEIDFIGPIPGIRIIPTNIVTSESIMQLSTYKPMGLTIGQTPFEADTIFQTKNSTTFLSQVSKSYQVQKTTPLGFTLEWGGESTSQLPHPMTSSIARGMPYVTMHYPIKETFKNNKKQATTKKETTTTTEQQQEEDNDEQMMYPTIVSTIDVHVLNKPIVDGNNETNIMNCTSSSERIKVEKEIQLYILATDMTWLIFFSQPVYITCTRKSNYAVPVKANTTTSSSKNNSTNATTTNDVPPPPPDPNEPQFVIQVVDIVDSKEVDVDVNDDILTIRTALMSNCTTGTNPMFCKNTTKTSKDIEEYGMLLRKHSNIYPGPNTDVSYNINHETNEALLIFDWDARDMTTKIKRSSSGKPLSTNAVSSAASTTTTTTTTTSSSSSSSHTRRIRRQLTTTSAAIKDDETTTTTTTSSTTSVVNKGKQQQKGVEGYLKSTDLLVISLPHQYHNFYHQEEEIEQKTVITDRKFCRYSMRGVSCLVSGNKWTMKESLPPVSFRAPRHPRVDVLETLAMALKDDIHFQLPPYMMKGAGDTYFVGKMLAKLARILLIAEEIMDICDNVNGGVVGTTPGVVDETTTVVTSYANVCNKLKKDKTLPTKKDFNNALNRLRTGVSIWHNGKAEAPFVYDSEWGGLVNCGCKFNENTTHCDNKFPRDDCPALREPGFNFGNGFYNDHHFHYGYHIYAAAAVAHFDNDWGRKNYENVLLLVRDIANPSANDRFFPVFRVKDWYMGNSWASGLVSQQFLNGKNEESASESIAAWEAVSLFGNVMSGIFKKNRMQKEMASANQVRDVGRLLTATEITATDWYWHVRLDNDDLSRGRIYPEPYDHRVVGNVWSTMSQFATWFGTQDFLVYGIQLLPTTPIAEFRDDTTWAREAYAPLSDSCFNDTSCEENGWSVQVYGMLAQLGHVDDAIQKTLHIPEEAYESSGGNGHSLTNSLWYISTRPKINELNLTEEVRTNSTNSTNNGSGTFP